MSDTVERADRRSLLATAHAAIDALIELGAACATVEESRDVLRSMERLRRKLPAVEHDVLLDLEAQGAHSDAGVKTMAGYLAQVLNLDPVQASARMHAARACGPSSGAVRGAAGAVVPAGGGGAGCGAALGAGAAHHHRLRAQPA